MSAEFAVSGDWALGADSLQWILYRRRSRAKSGWRAVSFVGSTREVLARCIGEKGCPPADAERRLPAFPSTFEEWAGKRVQTPATADLADGGGPPLGSADTPLPNGRDRNPEPAR